MDDGSWVIAEAMSFDEANAKARKAKAKGAKELTVLVDGCVWFDITKMPTRPAWAGASE